MTAKEGRFWLARGVEWHGYVGWREGGILKDFKERNKI